MKDKSPADLVAAYREDKEELLERLSKARDMMIGIMIINSVICIVLVYSLLK